MTFGCEIKVLAAADDTSWWEKICVGRAHQSLVDMVRELQVALAIVDAQSPAPDDEDKYLLDDGRCYDEVDIITLVGPRYGGPYGNRAPGKLDPVARGPVLGWHFVGQSRWVRCDVVVTREIFWYGYGESRRETEGVAQCMMFSTPYTAAWREAECWAFDQCIRECCR